jgi:hypothetical protein
MPPRLYSPEAMPLATEEMPSRASAELGSESVIVLSPKPPSAPLEPEETELAGRPLRPPLPESESGGGPVPAGDEAALRPGDMLPTVAAEARESDEPLTETEAGAAANTARVDFFSGSQPAYANQRELNASTPVSTATMSMQ